MDRPPELMSDAELAHALDQADADLARIETRRLRLIAAMDNSGYAERVGARDTVQYIEFRYRLDHSRAYRDVRLARALPKYAAVVAALPDPELAEDGEVPVVVLRPAQAEAIVTALEKVPTTVPVADLEFAEQELVRLARHLAPADLRKAAEQSRDILDTDGPEPDEHKAAARETLTLKTADHGVRFTGYLANENAELFRTLITTGARPHKTVDGERDPRSREKRQADALATTLTLAATALDAGTPSPTMPRPTSKPASSTETSTPETGSTEDDSAGTGSTASGSAEAGSLATDQQPVVVAGSGTGSSGDVGRDVVPGFGAKANLTVTIDFQDLKAATADAIGHTVYSNGLSAATIRRLACDAGVIPIVLGSNSEPLDVGRRERLVTKAIRRALNTRDHGCVVCGAPPVMCDAHHLISWIDGGETKVENLVLLCRRDHTDLHHGHWTITITNGQVHVTRPTWADPPPRPHKPPTDPPRAHKPPGQRPMPMVPLDEAPRVHEPGKRLTPSGLPDGGITSTGNPGRRISTPADDPWGETDAPAVPAAGASGVRSSRWQADESTRAEAARFAVWGERAPNDSDTGPPSFATI
ncbi:HNH endonuclease [Kribbella sindirgiensis]|uniref:HNH endonuclease n=1 Tax=Kribbella sindirgiensis TaxID=1124744 RepID=A0A4R0IGP0_9ACTN|nr:HNH endonuclease signature motif containing protein [Kribbella sindirgiensis]TCC31260.1 HNH endonuclease [Kribbella sindirgiensis]